MNQLNSFKALRSSLMEQGQLVKDEEQRQMVKMYNNRRN